MNWLEIGLKIILESVCIQNTFPLKELEKPTPALSFLAVSVHGHKDSRQLTTVPLGTFHLWSVLKGQRTVSLSPLLPSCYLLPVALSLPARGTE